ncbi:Dimeric alpha-beta barrel [Venturia nashicola]|uniref:Dimeric alpha-beta barrel n=1 Tax=Venturia nashicola TaxID=86259 RepID=A0A4Z1P5V4_9PEZI|nr:Dimeric alpha-beta barrel [Venturia nashicola]TLD22656.1 Dimeric alpha-beta barrel [Venturia nashicola]
MATSTGKKIEWLVILPDQQGAIERRMQVRPSHLANVKQDAHSGFWLLGGAFFSDVPKEGERLPPIIGSAMLAHAETKEEVLEKLKKDVYSESEVWDWSKVQIYPFKSAIGGASANV